MQKTNLAAPPKHQRVQSRAGRLFVAKKCQAQILISGKGQALRCRAQASRFVEILGQRVWICAAHFAKHAANSFDAIENNNAVVLVFKEESEWKAQ